MSTLDALPANGAYVEVCYRLAGSKWEPTSRHLPTIEVIRAAEAAGQVKTETVRSGRKEVLRARLAVVHR